MVYMLHTLDRLVFKQYVYYGIYMLGLPWSYFMTDSILNQCWYGWLVGLLVGAELLAMQIWSFSDIAESHIGNCCWRWRWMRESGSLWGACAPNSFPPEHHIKMLQFEETQTNDFIINPSKAVETQKKYDSKQPNLSFFYSLKPTTFLQSLWYAGLCWTQLRKNSLAVYEPCLFTHWGLGHIWSTTFLIPGTHGFEQLQP